MYTCIGSRLDKNNRLFKCMATSDKPSIPFMEEAGYLCSNCANSPPLPRIVYKLDLPDSDHPNNPEYEPCEMYHPSSPQSQEEIELDEINSLDELEMDS